MGYYKDTENKLHWLDSAAYEGFLPVGCVKITDKEAEELKPKPLPPDPKIVGIEFEGVMCSATRDDQNGLCAVLLASQMQGAAFKPTLYAFQNGNNLVLTKENMPAFMQTWMPFRQSFFKPE